MRATNTTINYGLASFIGSVKRVAEENAKAISFNSFHAESLVYKLLLFGQNTEFMDRFMLCAENHSATTLGLWRILKRSGSFPS